MKPSLTEYNPLALNVGLAVFGILTVTSNATNVLENKIIETVFALAFFASIVLIAIGGIQYISASQKISSQNVILRVFLYIFFPAIAGTILIVLLGYIFHAPGINPR